MNWGLTWIIKIDSQSKYFYSWNCASLQIQNLLNKEDWVPLKKDSATLPEIYKIIFSLSLS